MKKLLFIILLAITYNISAQKIVKTIDIINNSELPINVVYEECNISIKGEGIICGEEKTVTLDKKSSGFNYLNINFTGNKKVNTNGFFANQLYVVVKKITSSLGEEEFASFKDSNEIMNKLHESETYDGDVNSCWVMSNNGPKHTIILDHIGTNHFYCL